MEIDVKREAIKLFNETWDLIDLKERSNEQKALMLHKAHSSRYLWGLVGEPVNFARGEWQVSRVYALLGMGEGALLHGGLSLQLCLEHKLSPFDTAFGFESVARAYALLGKVKEADEHKEKGLLAAASMPEDKASDRAYVEGEINGIKV
jgi:hypothetical protein